ncbi:MAG: hypothetical protein Hals2KO_35450 [Halioglobus sp.]
MKILPARLFTLLFFTAVPLSLAADSLKGLLLTSPGIYHDYAYQSEAISGALAGEMNISFDVSLHERERWKTTDYSAGYDVLVYNLCEADNTDTALIANMRRQTETLRTPTIALHCAMHSFRKTDDWWPLYGLKTVRHEPIGRIRQSHAGDHPVLKGVPTPWTLDNDELYTNLAFDALPLLTAQGEDGAEHVTTWVRENDGVRIFGTTLGHSVETIDDPVFRQLLVNAVLWVTDNLQPNGSVKEGLEPNADIPAIGKVSREPGVDYLQQHERDCMISEILWEVGPCYVRCMLHPFKWGAAAQACKNACEDEVPASDVLMQSCRAQP